MGKKGIVIWTSVFEETIFRYLPRFRRRLPRGLQRACVVAMSPKLHCATLALAAVATFISSLALPFIRVIPGLWVNPFSGVVVSLRSNDTTFWMLDGIMPVWEYTKTGMIAIMAILILPILRLVLLCCCVAVSCHGEQKTAFCKRWAIRLELWSLVEYVLVGLFVYRSKSFPPGTIVLLAGFYYYLYSLLLGWISACTLKRIADG